MKLIFLPIFDSPSEIDIVENILVGPGLKLPVKSVQEEEPDEEIPYITRQEGEYFFFANSLMSQSSKFEKSFC